MERSITTEGSFTPERNELELAIEDFDQAIRLDPDNAGRTNNRGMALQEKGDLHGAGTDYDKALDINREHVQALLNRATLSSGGGPSQGDFRPEHRPPSGRTECESARDAGQALSRGWFAGQGDEGVIRSPETGPEES